MPDASDRPSASFAHRAWRTGVLVLGANLLIAVLLTLFTHGSFTHSVIYSNLIGLSIWAFSEIGHRRFLYPGGNSRTRWALVVLGSVLLGYLLGSQIANALLGNASVFAGEIDPRRAGLTLLISIVAGGMFSFYFASRTRLAQMHAQAETAQRQAAESRLKLLETQLEPHMLFNTLANLRALIAHDPARATEMLDRLIAYLRATLGGSRRDSHALSEEFERLRDYLELMAVRMGARLVYTLELPADLKNQPVPPLLLQPLVENAIRHGLEPKVQGGRLAVRAQRVDDMLDIEVSDTGVGLPEGWTESQGFGLAQVRERLATACGPKATMNVSAHAGGGVTITLRLPVAAVAAIAQP